MSQRRNTNVRLERFIATFPRQRARVLLLNQCFYPDVVSTGQHAADLAQVLAAEGHEVTVVTSRRAYDDKTRRFAARESWNGVRITRIWSSGLGKATKWRRAVDFASFLLSCTAKLLLTPKFDVVVAMTSPPLVSVLASVFVRTKGGHLCLWVMDLNPDEAIAAGWLRAGSKFAMLLDSLLQFSLRTAGTIVVLDRFMKERIEGKRVPQSKIHVVPPWSHDSAIEYDPRGRDEFRRRHGMSGKFVVMYSGNHSPCHPLDTLLRAALELRATRDVVFCFVGGGSEFPKVAKFAADHGLDNIRCLPYQPLSGLSASLSSADLHVVLMGDPFVGIVHPCKIYNVLALQIPFLYIGPRPSHITDLASHAIAHLEAGRASHGDVESVVRHIVTAANSRRRSADSSLGAARDLTYSQDRLVSKVVRLIESAAAIKGGKKAMSAGKRVLVTGAGGFIGHHLTSYLVKRGYWVRGVDIKQPEYEPSAAHEFLLLDLRRWENCLKATEGVDHVYALAANMGGIGFIESNKAVIVRDNTLINTQTIEAARVNGVGRFLFSSSACVYPDYRQQSQHAAPLKEEHAYPAAAEDGYGWEKLSMERTCRHYREDFGLETRVVRFHNIYGPLGTYDGGREKSPAAICRKAALAYDGDCIEVWGDGNQTRSYCYIDDCVEGLWRLMQSDYSDPLNLGTDRLVSINELVDIVSRIAGKRVAISHDLTKPQGVRGRNSDNTRLLEVLGWEPSVSLEDGLTITYQWIHSELMKAGRIRDRFARAGG